MLPFLERQYPNASRDLRAQEQRTTLVLQALEDKKVLQGCRTALQNEERFSAQETARTHLLHTVQDLGFLIKEESWPIIKGERRVSKNMNE